MNREELYNYCRRNVFEHNIYVKIRGQDIQIYDTRPGCIARCRFVNELVYYVWSKVFDKFLSRYNYGLALLLYLLGIKETDEDIYIDSLYGDTHTIDNAEIFEFGMLDVNTRDSNHTFAIDCEGPANFECCINCSSDSTERLYYCFNCTNCINCSDSYYCINCRKCDCCDYCNDCEDCENCDYCNNCKKCKYFCNNCNDCSDCEECKYCDKCSGVRSGYYCKECNTCVKCTLCNSSQKLSFCERCNNCNTCGQCIQCNECNDCYECKFDTKCSNCRNCSKCNNCNDCNDCITCNECEHCHECKFDTKCSSCKGCENCSDCGECQDCESCRDCILSTNCKECEKCSMCNQLCACTNCSTCTKLWIMKDKQSQLENQQHMHIDSTILADYDVVHHLNDDGYYINIYEDSDEPIIQLFDSNNNIICKCVTHGYNDTYREYPTSISLKQGWLYYPDTEQKYVYFMTSNESLTIGKLEQHLNNSENLVEYIKNKLTSDMKSSIIYVYDRNGNECYTTANL